MARLLSPRWRAPSPKPGPPALLPDLAASTSLSPTSTLRGGVLGGWMEARTTLLKRKHLPPKRGSRKACPGPQSRTPAEPGAGNGRGEATALSLSMGRGREDRVTPPGVHFAAQVQGRSGATAAWLHPCRTGGGLKSQGPFKGHERKFTPDWPAQRLPERAIPPYT